MSSIVWPPTGSFSDPMTTRGDIIFKNASGTTTRLAVGLSGQVLTSDGTDIAWANAASGFADPMTTRGDLIYKNAAGTTTRLGAGTSGQVLTSDGTDIAWAAATGFSDPMTTRGDLIYKNAAGTTTRLGAGTSGQVLTSDGTDIAWATPASGFADPMTTRGDLIYKNAAGTTTRLGAGTSGQVLTSDGTDIAWATPASGFADPMTTRGDLIYKNAAGTTTRLGAGTSGQVLTSDGTDIAWAAPATDTNKVTGPASATDNAIMRFDGTSGKVAQDSGATIDDSGNLIAVNITASGQVASTITDVGNSGTSKTINFNSGNVQFIDLTGNCTFTFSNPVSGAAYQLILKQDATGSRTVTWPATVKWPSGTAPTLSTAASAIDIVTLVYNGLDTEYLAVSQLNFS